MIHSVCRLGLLKGRGLLSKLWPCVFAEFQINGFALGIVCSGLKSGRKKGALRRMSHSIPD